MILRAALADQRIASLVACWGTPYDWGAGDPSTPWPPETADCSGFAQAALVHLDLLHPTQPDRTAFGLAMQCEPVKPGQERLGDLAFYGRPVSHVMVVIAPGIVLGARGGGHKTHGNTPHAYVDLRRVEYRRDLTVIGRPSPHLLEAM